MIFNIRIYESIEGLMVPRIIKLNSSEIIDAINRYLLEEEYSYEDKLYKSYTIIKNINNI